MGKRLEIFFIHIPKTKPKKCRMTRQVDAESCYEIPLNAQSPFMQDITAMGRLLPHV